MHTSRLETVCASVSVATTRCHSQEVPQMNKFEQGSSDHHQMSLAGGPQVWLTRKGVCYMTFDEGVP